MCCADNNPTVVQHQYCSSPLLSCHHFCDTDSKCFLRKLTQSRSVIMQALRSTSVVQPSHLWDTVSASQLPFCFLLIRNNKRMYGLAALTWTDIQNQPGGLRAQTGSQSWTIGPSSFGFQLLSTSAFLDLQHMQMMLFNSSGERGSSGDVVPHTVPDWSALRRPHGDQPHSVRTSAVWLLT